MSGDRLSTLEASYVWIERPRRPITVGGVATFEAGPLLDGRGQLRLDALLTHVTDRAAQFPRLQQRIRVVPWNLDRPHWEDAPPFDVAHHIRVVEAPAPGDDAALRAVAAEVLSEPFDPRYPPWHMTLVTGLDGDRIGLVERAHHALVDGIGGVDLAAVFLDVDRDGPPPGGPRPDAAGSNPDGLDEGAGPDPTAPVAVVADAFEGLRSSAVQLGRAAASAVAHPGDTAREAAAVAGGWATIVANRLTAPRSSVTGGSGPRRHLAWVRVRLDDVKAAAHATGGTVNDAVLAAVTTGLRSLLVERGEPVPHGLALKALVPVSRRAVEEVPSLGNQVCAVLAPLPVGLGDPAERMTALMTTMRRLKASGEAEAVEAFLHATDLLPAPVARLVTGGVQRQPFVNLVVTNVPGPPVPLYMLGARMLEAFPALPLVLNLSVGVAILSYDGALTVGLTADTGACPDVDVLAAGIRQGFTELGVPT